MEYLWIPVFLLAVICFLFAFRKSVSGAPSKTIGDKRLNRDVTISAPLAFFGRRGAEAREKLFTAQTAEAAAISSLTDAEQQAKRAEEVLKNLPGTLQAESDLATAQNQSLIHAAKEHLTPQDLSDLTKQKALADHTSKIKLSESEQLKELDWHEAQRKVGLTIRAALAGKMVDKLIVMRLQRQIFKQIKIIDSIQNNKQLTQFEKDNQLTVARKVYEGFVGDLNGLLGQGTLQNDNRRGLGQVQQPPAIAGGTPPKAEGTTKDEVSSPSLGDDD